MIFHINVSKSLYDNLKEIILKKDNSNYFKFLKSNNLTDTINLQIKKTLIFDNIVSESDNLIFNIDENNKFQALTIDEKNQIIYFVQNLKNNFKTKSRNTFLLQNLLDPYFFAIEEKKNISVSLNPLDIDYVEKIKNFPRSVKTNFEEIKTLGININPSLKPEQFVVFKNFKKYIDLKKNISKRNPKNKPTYIRYDDKKLIAYLKTDGANKASSFIYSAVISKLIKDNIKTYAVNLNSQNFKLAEKDFLENFCHYMVLNLNTNVVAEPDKTSNTSVKEILNFRNQTKFEKNIIMKYYEEIDCDQCFACDYMLKDLNIKSHIHRIVDIKEDAINKIITKEQAEEYSISGENGFLLCPNHDKEFENGYIFFDLNKKTFSINKNLILSEDEINCIKNRLKPKNFSNIKYSKNFEIYVKKHQERCNAN